MKTSSHKNTITLGRLREHLRLFDDDHEVFFGNGNLHFYRTKLRGEKLVQIEFDQHTDLLVEQEWTPVETARPLSSDIMALICRDAENGIVRMTGFYNNQQWTVIGNKPELRLVEVTHWCSLPDVIPTHRRGDPIG